MLSNAQFLEVIRESFKAYLEVGNSRSTAKLKILHGSMANDLQELFGTSYQIHSQGFNDDREIPIKGRYYAKKVDIAVMKDKEPIAGYAVKFVMRNYSQNSNNYFENMLGETANIRSNSVPYFQIFIIFDKVPYFKSDGTFKRYDVINEHNLDKYVELSNDDTRIFYHSPDKMLLIIVHLKEKQPDFQYRDFNQYAQYYKSVINDKDLLSYNVEIRDVFENNVILNDYNNFSETYKL